MGCRACVESEPNYRAGFEVKKGSESLTRAMVALLVAACAGCSPPRYVRVPIRGPLILDLDERRFWLLEAETTETYKVGTHGNRILATLSLPPRDRAEPLATGAVIELSIAAVEKDTWLCAEATIHGPPPATLQVPFPIEEDFGAHTLVVRYGRRVDTWRISLDGMHVTATPVGAARFTRFRYREWNRSRRDLRVYYLDPNLNHATTVDPDLAAEFDRLVSAGCNEGGRGSVRAGYYRPSGLYVSASGRAFSLGWREGTPFARPLHMCSVEDPHLDEKVAQFQKQWESKVWVRWGGTAGRGVSPEWDLATMESLAP